MEEYKNKVFLLEQYCDLGKTTAQIAEEIGCNRKTVVRWMEKFNVLRRPAKILLEHSGDREWIYRQYVELEKPIAQIAEETGYAGKTIWNWLVHFAIPRRPIPHPGNHVELGEELLTYLDGTLLGDGGLYSPPSSRSACYQIGQKYLSYINYVKDHLSSLGLHSSGQVLTMTNHYPSGKQANAYLYRTKVYRELRKQQERWYPNGKKRVPKDVRLTPLSIRTWFLEDGCLHRRKDCKTKTIILCTNAYTDEGRRTLVDGLKMRLDTSRIHISSQGTIRFSCAEVVKKFFDYILPLPKELEEDYGYKYP